MSFRERNQATSIKKRKRPAKELEKLLAVEILNLKIQIADIKSKLDTLERRLRVM